MAGQPVHPGSTRLRWTWSAMALAGTLLVLLGSFLLGLNFERANPEAYLVGVPLALLGSTLQQVRRRGSRWRPVPSGMAVLGAVVVFAAGYVAGKLAEQADFAGLVFAPPAAILGMLLAQVQRVPHAATAPS